MEDSSIAINMEAIGMETPSSRNLPIVLMGEHGDVDLAQEHWENWGFGMIFTTKNEALDAYIATYVGGDPQYYLL